MRRPLNGVQQVWSHLARFCWTAPVFTNVTQSEQSREPYGLTVQFTAMLLPCLGLPGWIALKGCPAGLPSRLDSFTASSRSQILHVRAGFPPWGRPPATRQRQTSHAEQAPCHRPHSPVPVPALLRRRRLSLLVIIEGDPLNKEEEEVSPLAPEAECKKGGGGGGGGGGLYL